jgi:hypothetical protein
VTAKKRGKLSAWVQALVFCGFDVEEVFAASEHNYTIGTQTSKFSFDQIRTMMLQNTVLEETLGEIAATYPDDRNSGVTDNHCGNGGCTVCLKSCGAYVDHHIKQSKRARILRRWIRHSNLTKHNSGRNNQISMKLPLLD